MDRTNGQANQKSKYILHAILSAIEAARPNGYPNAYGRPNDFGEWGLVMGFRYPIRKG